MQNQLKVVTHFDDLLTPKFGKYHNLAFKADNYIGRILKNVVEWLVLVFK